MTEAIARPKIVLSGFGSAGQRHAMNALRLGCEVITYDPRQMNAGLFDDVLDRSKDATHVVIASPPEFHYAQALASIDAGFPTLVEKPFTATLDEARELVRRAEEKGVPLASATQLRYLETITKTYQGFRGNRLNSWIGRCVFGYDIRRWHSAGSPYTPRVGVLAEAGTHEIDLLCYLYGTADFTVTNAGIASHSTWGETECMADFSLGVYDSRIRVSLDYTSPTYRRELTLSNGSQYLVWNLDPARDADMLIAASEAMMRDFLGNRLGEPGVPLASGEEAVSVLRILDDVRCLSPVDVEEPA